jgi:hypothetical protein
MMSCATDAKIKPDLSGPAPCGTQTCGSGQICVTFSAGSQCDVDPSKGIGPYDLISESCEDVPAACDGIPSCDCVNGEGLCLGGGGREMDFGCI